MSRVHYQEGKFALANLLFALIPKDENELNAKYLYHVLTPKLTEIFVPLMTGTANVSMKMEDAVNVKIPLPPIEKQLEIIAKIEKLQAVVKGAEMVIENWEVDESLFDGEQIELEKHIDFVSSGSTPLGGSANYVSEGILFIRSQNVLVGKTDFTDAVYITEATHNKVKRTHVKKNDVFLNITGASIGRSAVMQEDIEANVNQHVAIIRPSKTLLPEYLSSVLNTPIIQNQIEKLQTGALREGLNFDQIKKLRLPIPSIHEQLEIVERIRNSYQNIKNLELLKTETETKIKAIVNSLWAVE